MCRGGTTALSVYECGCMCLCSYVYVLKLVSKCILIEVYVYRMSMIGTCIFVELVCMYRCICKDVYVKALMNEYLWLLLGIEVHV